MILDVERLGLERVYDVVRVYRGLGAPAGFSAVPAPREPAYVFIGGRAPSAPLVFDDDAWNSVARLDAR